MLMLVIWLVLSGLVGLFASSRRNRSGVGWFSARGAVLAGTRAVGGRNLAAKVARGGRRGRCRSLAASVS